MGDTAGADDGVLGVTRTAGPKEDPTRQHEQSTSSTVSGKKQEQDHSWTRSYKRRQSLAPDSFDFSAVAVRPLSGKVTIDENLPKYLSRQPGGGRKPAGRRGRGSAVAYTRSEWWTCSTDNETDVKTRNSSNLAMGGCNHDSGLWHTTAARVYTGDTLARRGDNH